MIQPKIVYVATCDKCGDSFSDNFDTDESQFDRKEDLIEQLDENDTWLREGDYLTCASCLGGGDMQRAINDLKP